MYYSIQESYVSGVTHTLICANKRFFPKNEMSPGAHFIWIRAVASQGEINLWTSNLQEILHYEMDGSHYNFIEMYKGMKKRLTV